MPPARPNPGPWPESPALPGGGSCPRAARPGSAPPSPRRSRNRSRPRVAAAPLPRGRSVAAGRPPRRPGRSAAVPRTAQRPTVFGPASRTEPPGRARALRVARAMSVSREAAGGQVDRRFAGPPQSQPTPRCGGAPAEGPRRRLRAATSPAGPGGGGASHCAAKGRRDRRSLALPREQSHPAALEPCAWLGQCSSAGMPPAGRWTNASQGLPAALDLCTSTGQGRQRGDTPRAGASIRGAAGRTRAAGPDQAGPDSEDATREQMHRPYAGLPAPAPGSGNRPIQGRAGAWIGPGPALIRPEKLSSRPTAEATGPGEGSGGQRPDWP